MHEEVSYEGLDPIECEVRRRTFWLLFGGTSLVSPIPYKVVNIDLCNIVTYSGQINVNSLKAPDLSSRRRLYRPFPKRTR